MSDDDRDETNLPDAAAEEAACHALAHAVNRVCNGHEVGAILWALTLVGASVIRTAAPDDIETQAGLFAAVVNNMHAGLDVPEAEAVTLVIGDASELTPDQGRSATALCPLFASLVHGLAAHHDARDVLNAWASTLLVVLLDNGADRAQLVLQGMLDGLPAVEAQRQEHAAMDARANTDQVGRA